MEIAPSKSQGKRDMLKALRVKIVVSVKGMLFGQRVGQKCYDGHLFKVQRGLSPGRQFSRGCR